MQLMRFWYNAPAQWKTPDSFLRGGDTAITQVTTSLGTMANESGKRSCSSTVDGTARVKRVSIEGNIGKYSISK